MVVPSRFRYLRTEHPRFFVLSVFTLVTLLGSPVLDVYLREIGLGTPFWFADFTVYSDTIERWAKGGQIYVQNENGGYFLSYLYPPVTLLFFYLFTVFPSPTGAVLFSTVSLLLLWIGLEAVVRVLGYDPRIWERLVLLVALFGFQPALRNFKWAQMGSFLTAMLCFAFYTQELAAQKESPSRLYRYGSGLLTTVGSAFKLYFATAGAHLLRDRDRFVGAITTAGMLLAISLAIFGIEAHFSYIDVLLWGKGWGETRPASIWDTSAAYKPLAVLGILATPVRALIVLVVITLTIATRGNNTTAARHATFALGVAVIPLVAPRMDLHDLVVVLLPALILIALEIDRSDGYPSIPVLSVLLFHLHRYGVELSVNPPARFPLSEFVHTHAPWFQPGMWATFLLVGLAIARVTTYTTAASTLNR